MRYCNYKLIMFVSNVVDVVRAIKKRWKNCLMLTTCGKPPCVGVKAQDNQDTNKGLILVMVNLKTAK